MTETPSFGSGRREGHDASQFYDRFPPFVESTDEDVARPGTSDVIRCRDSRSMLEVVPRSVALVVTSPPYFSGRDYEAAEDAPETFDDYLQFLYDVFAECARLLEPGGRMAVNVAGLGRKPWRDLPGLVGELLGGVPGMALRGQIVWVKGRGMNGSAAWGSWRSPSAPTMRDVSERVVVAVKGRFGRAVERPRRRRLGLPHEATISGPDFMRDVLDTWYVRPESAKRVGHSAPFPVELPARLINLNTYRGDLVLDPFMGSGSTAVAAKGLDRRFVGYDTSPEYCETARARVAATETGSLLDA